MPDDLLPHERAELDALRAMLSLGLARRLGSPTPQTDEQRAMRAILPAAHRLADAYIAAGLVDLEELKAAAQRERDAAMERRA